MQNKNEKRIITLLSRLIKNNISKKEFLEEFKIKDITFYKYINLIKKAGFIVKNKKETYRILKFAKEVEYTKEETSIFAFLLVISNNYFSKPKARLFRNSIENILLKSDKNCYDMVFKKFEKYKKIRITEKSTEKQLALNKNETTSNNETIFEIRGRLANIYILKENERIIEKMTDKIIVANSENNKNNLFKRLLRYDITCKIMYPKSDADKFKSFIEKSLKNIS